MHRQCLWADEKTNMDNCHKQFTLLLITTRTCPDYTIIMRETGFISFNIIHLSLKDRKKFAADTEKQKMLATYLWVFFIVVSINRMLEKNDKNIRMSCSNVIFGRNATFYVNLDEIKRDGNISSNKFSIGIEFTNGNGNTVLTVGYESISIPYDL